MRLADRCCSWYWRFHKIVYTLSSCYFVELLGTSRRVLEGGCSIRCKLTANGDASNVLALCHGVVWILLLCYKQPNVLAVIKMS